MLLLHFVNVIVYLCGTSGKGPEAADDSSCHGRLVPLRQGHQTQALQREVSHLGLWHHILCVCVCVRVHACVCVCVYVSV